MTYRGTIRNGRIEVENGPELPDGTQINFELINWPDPATDAAEPDTDPLLDIVSRAAPTGIPDLAINHDHYLYGHPKVTDER